MGKVPVARDHKLIEAGLKEAEALAGNSRYDEAVNKLNASIDLAKKRTQELQEQQKFKGKYEQALQALQQRIAGLQGRDREGDPALSAAQGRLDQAAALATDGRYQSALDQLTAAEKDLGKAELAADRDDEMSAAYQAEQIKADNELAQLLQLPDTVTTEPLEQMISQAAALAQRGLFAQAHDLIKPHTEKYKELVALQKEEAGKKGDFPKQLENAKKTLLKLQGTRLADASAMAGLVADAEKAAGASKYASACKLLAEAARESEAQNATVRKAEKQEKRVEKYSPEYERLSKEVAALAAELRTLPGAEASAAQLLQDLDTAAALAKKQQFKDAVAALKESPKKAEEARKKSEEEIKKVGETSGVVNVDYGNIKKLSKDDAAKVKEAGKQYQEARKTLEAALKTYREVAPPAQAKELDQRVLAANTKVLGARKDTKATACLAAMNAGIQELRTITGEIAQAQTQLAAAKTECGTLCDELKTLLKSLWLSAAGRRAAAASPVRQAGDFPVRLRVRSDPGKAGGPEKGVREQVGPGGQGHGGVADGREGTRPGQQGDRPLPSGPHPEVRGHGPHGTGHPHPHGPGPEG